VASSEAPRGRTALRGKPLVMVPGQLVTNPVSEKYLEVQQLCSAAHRPGNFWISSSATTDDQINAPADCLQTLK
jgi:hypothetical protein